MLLTYRGWTSHVAQLASVAGLGIDSQWAKAMRLVFWGETVALFAFGVSWMTQGRLSGTALMDPRDVRDRNAVHHTEELADHAEDSI